MVNSTWVKVRVNSLELFVNNSCTFIIELESISPYTLLGLSIMVMAVVTKFCKAVIVIIFGVIIMRSNVKIVPSPMSALSILA